MSSEYRNFLLASLAPDDRDLLRPHLVKVELERGVLYRVGDAIEHASFIESGLLSLIARMKDGATIEITSIGREGAIGVVPSVQVTRSIWDIVVQVPAAFWRIDKDKMNEAMARSAGCRDIAKRLSVTALTQLGWMVACNTLHPLEARLARWLSLACDRLDTDTLPLTQVFLAEILGVKRTTVTQVAGRLQARGLIRYRWGTVQVVDREGLRAASCECYEVLQKTFERLRAGPQPP
jgi:CRP-like cAMP-binding protein